MRFFALLGGKLGPLTWLSCACDCIIIARDIPSILEKHILSSIAHFPSAYVGSPPKGYGVPWEQGRYVAPSCLLLLSVCVSSSSIFIPSSNLSLVSQLPTAGCRMPETEARFAIEFNFLFVDHSRTSADKSDLRPWFLLYKHHTHRHSHNWSSESGQMEKCCICHIPLGFHPRAGQSVPLVLVLVQ